jgi:segregation and condensation protein A
LPSVPEEATDRPLRARAAVASIILAGLKLAREDALILAQVVPFVTLQLAGALSSSDGRTPTSAVAANVSGCLYVRPPRSVHWCHV